MSLCLNLANVDVNVIIGLVNQITQYVHTHEYLFTLATFINQIKLETNIYG